MQTKPFPSPHHLVTAEAVDVPAERLYLLLRFPADSPALGNLWRWSGSGVPGTAMWEEGYEEKLYRAHREQSSMLLTGGAAGQLEERIVEQ
ncbi:hypothetical protein F2P79_022124, partial [Pimephales promelas]